MISNAGPTQASPQPNVTESLAAIDRALNGDCPCGANPRPGSPYCSYDCEPTHRGPDTDIRQTGPSATPMRWRPDLVTAADDTDLIPVDVVRAAETVAISEGRHNAHIYQRASDPTVWHLRLDDGHRYIGCDLADMGTADGIISIEQTARIHDAWQRLERELGNGRHLEPDDDPWRDVMQHAINVLETQLFATPASQPEPISAPTAPMQATRIALLQWRALAEIELRITDTRDILRRITTT